MAFRLPQNLKIGEMYPPVTPETVVTLENDMPPSSRVLVGIVFDELYDGITGDCQQAETALREAGIPVWPEYDRLITIDPDGEPVVWVSYQSSPAFWTPILLILGGIFLLPILSALPVWIIDKLFPGVMDMIASVITLFVLGGLVMMIPKMLSSGKEESK